MSTQYPIHGALATAEYSNTVEERARSLGMSVTKVLSLMNVGYGEPPAQEDYKTRILANPNRNLMFRGGCWYLLWYENRVRKHMKMSKDIEESRRMRDKFFAKIGYGK